MDIFQQAIYWLGTNKVRKQVRIPPKDKEDYFNGFWRISHQKYADLILLFLHPTCEQHHLISTGAYLKEQNHIQNFARIKKSPVIELYRPRDLVHDIR